LRIFGAIKDKFKRTILDKIQIYEKKFKLQRTEFLKIYIYYIALCFISIWKEKGKGGKGIVVCDGVDIDTIKKEGFP
jgi:hypothetical protein